MPNLSRIPIQERLSTYKTNKELKSKESDSMCNKVPADMLREELIDELIDTYGEEYDDFKYLSTERLMKKVCDYREEQEGDLFPNGRDYDAEDEDSPC